MSEQRRKAIAGLRAGDTFTIKRTFTAEEVKRFGDLTRDYNPVHYDERYCAVKGFDNLICHGLLVGGMVCEIGGQVGWLASGMSFSFIKPIYFGRTITCTMTITELDESGRAKAEADFVDDHGELVLRATLQGIIPVGETREILQKMADEGDPTNQLHHPPIPNDKKIER